MPAVNLSVLKSALNKDDIRPVYFIFGADGYLKRQYTDKIIDKTADRNDVFNFMLFESGAKLSEVYDAVMQLPMMAEKKCVVLCDYDFEKADKADFTTLKEIIEATQSDTVFIIWCNNYSFDFKKSERARKIIAATEKQGGMAVQIDHLTPLELRKMLISGAAKRKIVLPMAAADRFINNCGEDIFTLRHELEKLCSYCTANSVSEITAEIIEQVTVKSLEASVFELSDKIFAKNTAGAIKLIDELLYLKTEPAVILHSIFSSFIDAYRVFAGNAAGVNNSQISADFSYGKRGFVLDRVRAAASKMDSRRFSLCFKAITEADVSLKSFSASERTVLEQLIIRLIFIISKGTEID